MTAITTRVGRTKSGLSSIALAMFSLMLATYAINAMDRLVFPLLASDIRKEFGFTVADTGLIGTIFTIGLAIAGWPTAYLLSRLPRKAVFQVGAGIFSAATILIALAAGFFDMLTYRALTGVGEVMQQIALTTIATSYFVRSRAFAIATTQIAFSIGNFAGPLLASTAVAIYGEWRGAFWAFGLAGFAMMAFVAVFVRRDFTEIQSESSTVKLVGGADKLLNRNTVILAVMTLLTGPVLYGYLGLYSTFLREQMHFAPQDVAKVMSFFGLGGLFAPVGGWIGDRASQRSLLMAGYAALALFGYLLFSYAQSVSAHCVLSLCWGFAHAAIIYVNLWSAQIKTVDAKLNAKASGVFFTCLYTTSAFSGYLMGSLVTAGGWANAAMIQISLLSIICVVLSGFISPALFSKPSTLLSEST
ncbi:MFS transporter [Bradyrhizobium sp. U87765 SZCCT0131]|uniref:MFS transporter n=1 Tax=unclassified Bradyrhizobium TaxID=2631580 RepID=UPI001BAB1E4F|nr:MULTISPECIES: MFS transporter [unclassified Bradyrhizobium]MBR1221461.1 MFS transporter [Bradyrhizobium sp. U87765 SZCCT0131]MBR1264616.1 MFS transporter [Bradyrhizobium sp. U87765 SZCCT0134]MBR1304478.1 MFS transporter [Bradyrhizobium sp. U87765 SZCCT0110]MBR1322665.1 MFS transporter [Bradyrhizobium sp. U87765 SZCCT0109]MBR1346407.1 MFS transporter [Bradyrhizobium sp. U87765 SZCCT0048]